MAWQEGGANGGRVGAEGRAGEDYVVVGRDGTVQLPPDLLDALPPGTLARAVRHDNGVDLRRVYDPSARPADGETREP